MKMLKNGKKLDAPFVWNTRTMPFCYYVRRTKMAVARLCATLVTATLNCFDQFQKASSETQQLVSQQEGGTNGSTPVLKLVCPLCRGEVNGWVVVESARLFMNSKTRSCASEACDFSGTYADLRKHARLVHPLVRPSEADPDRQRDWRRLERQRDIGDLLSSLQSSIRDERVEDISNNSASASALSFDEGGWMTVSFLIRVFRPRSSSSSSSWSGTSRARAHVTVRRRPSARLWGETHDDESRDDDNDSSDGGSGPPGLLQNDESLL
ncbi:hypothetical protein HanOQP8_Chr05g0180381 [Helianthus annuus]|nr:hypothetical protein HanIR_Chr05g0223281 [Helianthus annuus]KAJ0746651.1 hypothetical protein HanOQP8_Chr05g0180381 [Helianthus annuus]